MNKHDLYFFKKTLAVGLIIIVPISLLFIIVSIFYDALEKELLLYCLIPFFCFAIILLVACMRTIFERLLVYKQVKQYNMVFNFENTKRISKESMVFLSNNCVIYSGRLILHKDFIISISSKNENRYNSMGGYYCICKCRDGRNYRIFVPSTGEVKAIKRWYCGKSDQMI